MIWSNWPSRCIKPTTSPFFAVPSMSSAISFNRFFCSIVVRLAAFASGIGADLHVYVLDKVQKWEREENEAE